ncbi:MAG: hypothetical protein JWQ84_770 [Mucilaginibacter sp.]|nr:hypothetical protein [Mucilaginibacter sp.]
MNKPISFVFTFVLLLELSFLRANAQTSASEIQTDIIARKAIKFLNAGLPDSVYQLAGSQFKKQINPDLWNSIYKSQFSAFLPFKEVDFINSVDSVNKYKLVGQVTLTYYVSLDKEGKLKDFLFKPYQEESTAAFCAFKNASVSAGYIFPISRKVQPTPFCTK